MDFLWLQFYSWALKITAKQKVINVNLVSEENKLRSKEMWK